MSKIKKLKNILDKQKIEFDKPNQLYNKNKNFRKVVDYTDYYEKMKINKNSILIITTRLITNNTLCLINMFKSDFKNYNLIIAIDENINTNIENVTYVKKESYEFLKCLSSSEIIINCDILPSYFIRKKEQKVIQLTDIFSGQLDEKDQYEKFKIDIQRTLFQSSHILFKNKKETELYTKLFNLKNIFNGKIYEDLNIYCPVTENEEKSGVMIFTKKYTRKQVIELLKVGNSIFDDLFIYVHPTLHKYYSHFKELQFILIKSNISKEFLNLQSSIVISDNYADLIGIANYHIDFNLDDLKVTLVEKQNYISNFNTIKNIIKGNEDDFISLNNNNKMNILMYCGGFLNNGITSSAINLSNQIDYNKYNLIIIDKSNLGEVEKYNMNRLNDNVNLIYRMGQSNTTFSEFRKNQFVTQRRGYRKYLGEKELKTFSRRELKRLLGDIKIDIAIDFSGYVPFWTSIFAFSDARTKIVYQHNDLKSETEKQINGEFKHKYILPRVFSLYRFYNKIISVSLQTKELNARNLKNYASYRKFDFVNNSIDYEDILEKIRGKNSNNQLLINNKEYYLIESYKNMNIIEPKSINKTGIQLITIGRLSPEKDHHKLLLSLKKVIDEYPEIDINLIILGSGVMEDELKKLVNQLGISEYVSMKGQVDNPYQYLNEADCFILSSNHEGQPMVLLEALALHKPIIATDITGNRSVLEGTNGQLVENSIEGLKNGIIDLINGNIKKNTQFDINKYNESAISRFYTKVCK
ncbi:glycosyltransferase [Staphylococcus saprophyticus]|uniref:glycosyltransferase n=3 Tax=Staphylococcus TaxID=1279 RepID=UPI000660CA62|nr:glycosyltransferase [Staphylococcus saprophyticus]AMG34300.1 glycosyl transferase [Staphylococcus saprophyticus]MBO0382796.1 glycosyltransferase [Staphylococcus saprophyticus]MDK1672385.1 glycosyltransferase [Staphylococcus saprophyticus]MDW3804348.1 glycosyltransferase [Staphylococcus saprophyticus]MDW3839619.1 glycosyltransferase [Staphylococcus saprophyticus]